MSDKPPHLPYPTHRKTQTLYSRGDVNSCDMLSTMRPSRLLLVEERMVVGEQTFSNLQKVIAATVFAKDARRVLVMPKGFLRFNMSALVRTTTAADVADVLQRHPAGTPCSTFPCNKEVAVLRVSDALLWYLVSSVEATANFEHVAYTASWVARAHSLRSEIGLPSRYGAMHLRLEKSLLAGFNVDISLVRQKARTAMAAANLRVLFVASDSEPGARASRTMECGNMSDGTQCRLRGRAEAVHVKLVDGLRADGLEVHTLSSAQSHLSRAERSIVDHILCEEAELFLRPCAACHDPKVRRRSCK